MATIHHDLISTECIDTLRSMDDSVENHTDDRRHERLLERVDHMVKSGRLTGQEAERLRAAAEPDEFDDVVRDIRVRHAGTSLDAAVEEGSMTEQEADAFLQRVESGEDPRSLRAQLRRLRPRPRRTG
jgi:polyhydroxyalkanoate synthesis regulator phasin